MESIVFVLPEVSCFKLLFCLFIRLLKLFQLSLSLFNLALEEFLFLRKELSVCWVEFQELFNIFQTPLRTFDVFFNIF